MLRSVRLCLGFVVALQPVRGASPLLEQAMELPGFAMWADSGSPGMVLGVVRG